MGAILGSLLGMKPDSHTPTARRVGGFYRPDACLNVFSCCCVFLASFDVEAQIGKNLAGSWTLLGVVLGGLGVVLKITLSVWVLDFGRHLEVSWERLGGDLARL